MNGKPLPVSSSSSSSSTQKIPVHKNTVAFVLTPLQSTGPSPSGLGSVCRRPELGERRIDETDKSVTPGGGGGAIRIPSSIGFVFHLESLHPSLFFFLCLRVCWCLYLLSQVWAGAAYAPYDCRFRVNFHCWLRLGLHTSTVSPPILALRLSRQRLLPRWRSLELDSICSHFCLLSFSRQP